MNKAENQVRPNEDDAFALDMSDFQDNEELDIQDASLEDTKQTDGEPTENNEQEKPVENVETEPKEEELDFTPFLDKLSKDIKYMDEDIKIGSVDEIKTLAQKGLNHDRLQEKLNSLENSDELQYIREQAKKFGLTTTEYIKEVKEFEKIQQEEQDKKEYQELIDNGVSEDLAKKVIENNKIAREWQQDKAKRKEEDEKKAEQLKKDAEYDEFLKLYPNVDVKSIPKEVLVASEKIGLTTAYTKYHNEQLTKEIAQLKQNKQNEEKAPVKGVSEHGGVVIEHDDFLKGLGI